MADFRRALEKTLANEGEYVHRSDDKGGETYKGIARNYHPEWVGWKVIDEIKRLKAIKNTINSKESWKLLSKILGENIALQRHVEEFYREHYWDKLALNDYPSQVVAEKLFDIAVNQGVSTAVQYMRSIAGMEYKILDFKRS